VARSRHLAFFCSTSFFRRNITWHTITTDKYAKMRDCRRRVRFVMCSTVHELSITVGVPIGKKWIASRMAESTRRRRPPCRFPHGGRGVIPIRARACFELRELYGGRSEGLIEARRRDLVRIGMIEICGRKQSLVSEWQDAKDIYAKAAVSNLELHMAMHGC
jgi:hypothetical protein